MTGLVSNKFACWDFVDRNGCAHKGHLGHYLEIEKLPVSDTSGYGYYISGERKLGFKMKAVPEDECSSEDESCYMCYPQGMAAFLLRAKVENTKIVRITMFTTGVFTNSTFRANFLRES